MQYLAIDARQWREELQRLLDLSIEQDMILVYLRRKQPIFFILPFVMGPGQPQQRLEYGRLLQMYNRITKQDRPMPDVDERLPWIPTNGLRRDITSTLNTLKVAGVPFILKRYADAIGFVVPVLTGKGGMEMVKNLAIWFYSQDMR